MLESLVKPYSSSNISHPVNCQSIDLIIDQYYCPACANVKLLSEFDRSEAYNYKQEKRGRPKCDRNLAPGWYRFGGRAGTAMSLRCVAKYHCGTDAPGWLAGSHPTTEQGTVLRDVCFNFDGDCCKWKYQVEVRNCGAFYAYRLERTHSCFLRYCGNSRPGNAIEQLVCSIDIRMVMTMTTTVTILIMMMTTVTMTMMVMMIVVVVVVMMMMMTTTVMIRMMMSMITMMMVITTTTSMMWL